MLLQLYKSMVQPILEYGNVIWGPHYVLDQQTLEDVQWYATKLVPSLRDESFYTDQLTSLNLPVLGWLMTGTILPVDIVTNSSLNSFKSAADNYFMTSD